MNKSDLTLVGIGFLGGVVGGYVLTKYFPSLIPDIPSDIFSFATVDCANLCSTKNCSEYNCKCTNGCDACGGVAAVGNCGDTTSPPPTTGAPKSRWFFAGGKVVKLANARCNKTKCGVDTGSGSGGNRWETVQSGWMDKGFEVVLYVTVKNGAMCGGGDEGHIGLKHGGPQHKQCASSAKIKCGNCKSSCSGSGCCCWWDSGLREDGSVYLERERPHACNGRTKKYGGIGRKIDNGQPLGCRWLIKKESGGVRLMFWVDTSGTVNGYNWKKMYDVLDKGDIMESAYYSKITKEQNIEIRMSDVNCNDIKIHSAEARKI